MRCLGMQVVPPVSKILKGRPLNAFGTHTSGCKSRSHSSWKCGNRDRSANDFTSFPGFHPAFLAQSSQNGQPVSGEKCHCTTSRTCASSFFWPALMAAESTVIMTNGSNDTYTYHLPATLEFRFLTHRDAHWRKRQL